jgi:hypothetical protein
MDYPYGGRRAAGEGRRNLDRRLRLIAPVRGQKDPAKAVISHAFSFPERVLRQ